MNKNMKEIIKKENLILPDYKNINIVDVVRCLYLKCGYSFNCDQKILELDKSIPNNKHYLFIVSDGTGANIINKLNNNSILKKYKKDEILTIFPSTTGCVLTSIVTGEYPEKHGIWGWFNYNRDLDKDYYPVLFADRKTMKSLDEFKINSEDIYKTKSVLKKLNIKVNILFPKYINDSVYSKFVSYDKDRYAYDNYNDIEDLIKNICKNKESSYTYLYLPDIDSIEHENGIDSEIVMDKLNEIDNLIKSITENKDLTIVFTADHGQTNINNDIIIDFSKYDRYFYAYPSIDFGTASYYVKRELEDDFIKEFNNDFKDKMYLFKTEDFINNNFFGIGDMSKYALDNLGEYISLCKTGSYLINSNNVDEYLGKIKGNHSGLTKDEMIIPLIIIDTNKLEYFR